MAAGVLRLSHKYEAVDLRKRALAHLSAWFPTTLTAWDVAEADLITHQPDELLAIPLAREIDAPWVLPAAFYLACARGIDLDRLFDDTETSERSHQELSSSDKKALIKGSYDICDADRDVLRFMWDKDIQLCASCLSARSSWWRKVETWREDGFSSMPLTILNDVDWEAIKDELCGIPDLDSRCFSLCQRAYEDARQSFWNRIPAIFGLPDWAELEQLKKDALS